MSRQQLAVHPPNDLEASRPSHHNDWSSDTGVDRYPEASPTVSTPRTPVQPAADSVPYVKQGNKRFVNEECVICLAEFEDGEVCQVLANCQHVYHRECIYEWMSRSSCCPICRVPAMDIRISKFGENPIT
ncbi:hypothetical protein MLD38_003166 [Melastoma candidum]|nr:hypothetical protein MLD38_003166 [Melastoma candidum]